MNVLDASEAASLLKMSQCKLKELANTGEIPAAKPAKNWLFIDTDLFEWLRSQYTTKRQDMSKGENTCSLNEKTSGTTNLRLVEKQYTDLLAPATKKKHKK